MSAGLRRRAAPGGVALLLMAAIVAAQDRSVVVTTSDPGGRGDIVKRYWAEYPLNAIRRSNPDGSEAETFVGGVSGPYGISFDSSTGRFLWTSSGDEAVQIATTDGRSVATLPSSFEDAFVIKLVEGDFNVAYAVENNELVKVSRSRTSEAVYRQVLLTLGSPTEIHGLALSQDRTMLYLGDSVGRMTRRLRLADGALQSLEFDAGGEPEPTPSPSPTPEPSPSPCQIYPCEIPVSQ